MDGSEIFALLASLTVASFSWIPWFRDASVVRGPGPRGPLQYAPAACFLVLFAILKLWSSFDVRDSPLYMSFYLLMGAAWVGAAMRTLPWLGVSARDDVLERGNRAALWPVLGALLGATLAFAGGNIGDGPGWWVVVFCGLLSTGGLFGLLWLVDRLAAVVDAVTVDRDPASGVRLGAFLAAAGLVLGRAVAGDWHSAGEAVSDFVARGWPAAALAAATVGFQKAWSPTANRPARGTAAALLPAALLLAAAVGWVARLGEFR